MKFSIERSLLDKIYLWVEVGTAEVPAYHQPIRRRGRSQLIWLLDFWGFKHDKDWWPDLTDKEILQRYGDKLEVKKYSLRAGDFAVYRNPKDPDDPEFPECGVIIAERIIREEQNVA